MLNIKEINESISDYLKDKKFNFAKCLIPEDDKKISIIGKYNPQLIKGFIGLDENLKPIDLKDSKDYYYGVSPKLSESIIIEAISDLKVTSTEKLKKFVLENRNYFFLHQKDKEYIYYFAEYVCLRLLNLYGIRLYFHSGCDRDKFYNECITSLTKDIFLEKDSNNPKLLKIKGCPDDKLLDFFNQNYVFYMKNNLIIIEEKSSNIIDLDKYMKIKDVYHERKNIKLLEGSIFYSGCLLKALKIEKLENANLNVDSYCVHFERTSFAAVACINFHYKFLFHPFLSKIEGNYPIIDFFKKDDRYGQKMYDEILKIDCLNDKDSALEIINTYLLLTSNTPQICVSGNLITEDNYMILTKRAKNSIDENLYYPGINGNAEIADSNVEFYFNSVEEDFPEIDLDSKRIDFNGELSRECFAELGISLDKRNWKPMGIVMFGKINRDKDMIDNYPLTDRRVHFSLLFEQKTSDDLKSLIIKQKNSTENYENQKVKGCKINCYNSLFHMIMSNLFYSMKKMLGIKALVTAGLSIALFFIFLANGSYYGTIEKYVSLIFAFLVFLDSISSVILNLYDKYKLSKNKKDIYFISSKVNESKVKAGIENILEIKNTCEVYPVSYIALRLYIEKKLKNKKN